MKSVDKMVIAIPKICGILWITPKERSGSSELLGITTKKGVIPGGQSLHPGTDTTAA